MFLAENTHTPNAPQEERATETVENANASLVTPVEDAEEQPAPTIAPDMEDASTIHRSIPLSSHTSTSIHKIGILPRADNVFAMLGTLASTVP